MTPWSNPASYDPDVPFSWAEKPGTEQSLWRGCRRLMLAVLLSGLCVAGLGYWLL